MTDEELAGLSDEEFKAYENSPEALADEPDLDSGGEIVDESEEVEADSLEDNDESQSEDDEENQDDIDSEESNSDEENTKDVTETEEESDTEEDTQETQESEAEVNTGTAQDVANTETNTFQNDYEAIMAPIKANGEEITIKSKEDARRLIQMGLNYEEKMIGIKPVRLAGKALENAGIIKDGVIDEQALNRMIDFNNGNLDVMKQRLKELEIDPLDLELEDVNYTAENHMVQEQSLVIDDIQRELDSRGTTNEVIGALDGMDEGSRNYFNDNPQDLLGLEQDIASGAFAEINGAVQYEKRMGRLVGKTDMEAYIELAQARASQQQVQATETPKVNSSVKTVNKDKRAKAGGSKPSKGKNKAVPNMWDMSDDEFNKEFGNVQALR